MSPLPVSQKSQGVYMFPPVLRKQLTIQKEIVLSPGTGIHNNESIQAMWCLHLELVYSSLSHIYSFLWPSYHAEAILTKNNPHLLFFLLFYSSVTC